MSGTLRAASVKQRLERAARTRARRETKTLPTNRNPFRLQADRGALARHWLALAILALATSGLVALAVAALRVPPVARSWTDAELASRLLVVHVDLGVIVWFLALPVALFHLFVLAGSGSQRAPAAAAVAPWLATIGAVMLLSGLVPGLGSPHPINYIPLVTHPVYVLGLALFLAGVALSFLDRHLLVGGGAACESRVGVAGGGSLPPPVVSTLARSAPLVRLGAVYFLLALVTLGIAYAALPDGLVGEAHTEILMWGAGHVLQYTNVAFALVAWALLAAWASGRPIAGRRAILATWLVLAVSVLPILALLPQSPAAIGYREGFTRLMQWGLFPAVLLFVAAVLVPHLLSRRPGGHQLFLAALWPLVASVALMLAGFLFGAFIRGSDLRIPGHYHACIGAVTLAFMALTLLLPGAGPHTAGAAARSRPGDEGAVRWVAILYGTGQLVFSTGLFVAGSYGLGRKTYGAEQELANPGQGIGLAVMAVGGTLALAGGVTWAVAALRRLLSLAKQRF